MKRQLLHTLSFVVAVAVLVGVLKALNWTPGALEQGLMRKYSSVEAVTSGLGIRKIYVPSYFPETLQWPPAEILAQSRPYEAVVMTFARVRDGETVLVISQAVDHRFEPGTAIRFHVVTETVSLDLSGRKALLEAGTCEDRSACSRIEWNEGATRIMLAMKAPSVELIRIAESMPR